MSNAKSRPHFLTPPVGWMKLFWILGCNHELPIPERKVPGDWLHQDKVFLRLAVHALRVNCFLRTVRRVRKRFRETGEGWVWCPKEDYDPTRSRRFASLGELTDRFSQTPPSPVSQMTLSGRLYVMGMYNSCSEETTDFARQPAAEDEMV